MRYIMNKKEQLKKQIIELAVKGEITVRAAADRLQLSERQVKNLKARYKKIGASSIIHGNCGRQPKHTLTPEKQQKILEIKEKEEYKRINFLHFEEELVERFKIKVSYTALRNLLNKNGIKSPKKHRRAKVKHQRRDRKERFGEMVQGDATPYDWFEIGEKMALHALIDDATGKLTGLYFCKNECAEGYFRILKQTIKRHGSPQSIYVDGLKLFFSDKKTTIEEELEGKIKNQTQMGNILEELGTRLIHARSPQAKGRVERLWETLQSRLPVELKKRKIKDAEKANKFLEEEYIEMFNKRFGIEASKKAKAFIKKPKGVNLDTLLSIKHSRKLDNSGCFLLDGVRCYSNIKDIKPKTKVEIIINERLGVKVMYEGKLYEPIPILDKKKNQVTGSSVNKIFRDFVRKNCLKNEHVA